MTVLSNNFIVICRTKGNFVFMKIALATFM